VPISAVAGRDILGVLDASELTSAAVTDLLKAREDKGVAERTAASDLKAREAEAAKKALEEEKARLEAQRKAMAEQEAAAKAAQAEADRLKAAGSAEAAKAQEEAKRQADELAVRRAEEKAAAEKLAAEQKAVADREKELAAEKAQIEKDKAAIEAAKTPEQKAAELAAREADVLPYFRRAEHNERGADAFHGDGGPLNVADLRSPNPFSKAFVAAGEHGPAGVGAIEITAGDGRGGGAHGVLQDHLADGQFMTGVGGVAVQAAVRKRTM
jgi:hypothetical protein